MEHRDRIQPLFSELGADAFLLTDENNMRYLTGFTGEGTVYISKKRDVVITDSRYIEVTSKETKAEVVMSTAERRVTDILADCIREDGVRVLCFEDQQMSCATFSEWKEKLPDVEQWLPAGGKISALHEVKTAEEIGYIARAEAIGDLAFAEILEVLRPGMTELEVAAELEYRMKRNGAHGISFDTIIASGANSSKPHAVPSEKKLETGDFVTMDFGCTIEGYHSDMTRTVVLGKANEKQREIYDIVLRAQLAALDAVRPGANAKEVDAIARGIITEAGYGEYFGHRLGHSVGLEIHEGPSFGEDVSLLAGHVLTDEPGIYLPDFGGVRIEDTFVVTPDGYRNLTSSPKELIEL